MKKVIKYKIIRFSKSSLFKKEYRYNCSILIDFNVQGRN